MTKIANIFFALFLRMIYRLFVFFDSTFKEDLESAKRAITLEPVKNQILKDYVLTVEDKRFYQHKGVDVRSIIRALYQTLFKKRIEGGSTIEQQYIRLITNKRQISFKRKLREWLLAVKLNNSFSKDEILNTYFLRYKFLGNIQGVDQYTKERRFNLENLTPEEMYEIIARLKYPFMDEKDPRFIKRVKIVAYKINKNEKSFLIPGHISTSVSI